MGEGFYSIDMKQSENDSILQYEKIFPCCHKIIGATWRKVIGGLEDQNPDSLIDFFGQRALPEIPFFIGDLARLEKAVYDAGKDAIKKAAGNGYEVNPTLRMVEIGWDVLPLLQNDCFDISQINLLPFHESILVFRGPKTKKIKIVPAHASDLLALKVVAEKLDPSFVAGEGNVSVSGVRAALDGACRRGILLKPNTLIRRPTDSLHRGTRFEDFQEAPIFTIQWHITQACDLRCKHCYDRSNRESMSLEQGRKILDDFHNFCHEHRVLGQVSFTGGNPFFHPDFVTMYQEAADRNFNLAILGNPVSSEKIEEIGALQRPVFYQVSLEGLEKQTDYIRGKGHFQRTLTFLDILKAHNIYSMVMLTLTKDNMMDVVPLAAELEGRTDLFTYNRLATVGEGANLEPVDPQEYITFLGEYLNAAKKYSVLRLKDNLFNILLDQRGDKPFGGCAGYGCGAAFNFVSILSDGEVHACRKLPSPIGNINDNSLTEIYHSRQAQRYRAGSKACQSCSIRPVCGGCLAVVHGQGLDVFEKKDPYCFMHSK